MTRTLITLIALAALVSLATLSRTAAAQDLRGTVRDSASGLPVSGAVIMLQDARGETLARNLSGARGGFVLPLRPEARRVRVRRLGYRPRDVDVSPPVAASIQLDVVLAALPTLLQGMRVTADGQGALPAGQRDVVPDARCAPRADREQALALLDQARAGLLSVVVAREANPARVTRAGFTRTLDVTGTRIVGQQVRVDSAADQTVSFNAVRSAAEFVRDGFRRTSGGDQTLYAPDADILLDDVFARGYCFHLAAPDAKRGHEAGLGFSPASRRRGRVDIEGALWIDTVARALVNIEFRYRGVGDQAERMGAGGHIGFRDMPGGVTMIDRWWLRLVGGSTSPPQPEWERPAFSAGRPFDVRETGGELVRADWRDGTRWEAPLGTLQITLARRDGSVAAGVGVALDGTGYRAISDGAGRVTFAGLVPGPYRVVVVDPLLVPLGVVLPTPVAFDARRATTHVLTVAVPTVEDFLADACGVSSRSPRSAWLVARAMNNDGTPANDARWRLRKLTANGWITVADGEGIGSIGLIHDCTFLQQRDRIELRAWRGGDEARFVGEVRDRVNVIPLTFPAIVASRATGDRTSRPVVLTGTVTDSLTGALVSEARVSLAGTLLETATDSVGRFMIAGIPRGDYVVETSSPWLDSIGAVRRVKVAATSDATALVLHVPLLSQVALATCGAVDVTGVVVGRVGLRDGGALPGAATVTAAWRQGDVVTDATTGGGPGQVRSVSARTDGDGLFRLCGVPANTALTLHAVPDAGLAATMTPVTIAVDGSRRFARIDLVLDRVARNPSFNGTIVTDSSGPPVPHTEARSPDLAQGTVPDARGSFRLADIPPGAHVVHVRAAGPAVWTSRLTFAAGRDVDGRISIRPDERTPAGQCSTCTPPLHSENLP